MTYATVSSSHDEPAAGAQKGRSGGATAGTASGKRVTSGGGPAAAGGAKKTLLAMKRKREVGRRDRLRVPFSSHLYPAWLAPHFRFGMALFTCQDGRP